jgi:hypothetical protein
VKSHHPLIHIPFPSPPTHPPTPPQPRLPAPSILSSSTNPTTTMFHRHAPAKAGAPFTGPVFFAPPTAGDTQRDTHHKSQLVRLLYIFEVGGQAPVDDEGTVPTSLVSHPSIQTSTSTYNSPTPGSNLVLRRDNTTSASRTSKACCTGLAPRGGARCI